MFILKIPSGKMYQILLIYFAFSTLMACLTGMLAGLRNEKWDWKTEINHFLHWWFAPYIIFLLTLISVIVILIAIAFDEGLFAITCIKALFIRTFERLLGLWKTEK